MIPSPSGPGRADQRMEPTTTPAAHTTPAPANPTSAKATPATSRGDHPNAPP